MALPKRKSMRLKGYDYSQNGAYFVTICTHNRECLFGEIVGANLCVRPNDPHIIIEKHIIELENKYKNVVINKYIIMPNHIHFILSINNKTGEHIGSPLHEMIQWFKTQTTNEYIRGVKNNMFPPFDKHIWQRGYYEHIIRNETSYNEIWNYIDNNILSWEQDKLYTAK